MIWTQNINNCVVAKTWWMLERQWWNSQKHFSFSKDDRKADWIDVGIFGIENEIETMRCIKTSNTSVGRSNRKETEKKTFLWNNLLSNTLMLLDGVCDTFLLHWNWMKNEKHSNIFPAICERRRPSYCCSSVGSCISYQMINYSEKHSDNHNNNIEREIYAKKHFENEKKSDHIELHAIQKCAVIS